jgi:hypothetical protein
MLPHPSGEGSYRRGVHQALALAGTLLGRCRTIEEGRELVGRAEDEAASLRGEPGFRGTLIDEINDRVRLSLTGGDRP